MEWRIQDAKETRDAHRSTACMFRGPCWASILLLLKKNPVQFCLLGPKNPEPLGRCPLNSEIIYTLGQTLKQARFFCFLPGDTD